MAQFAPFCNNFLYNLGHNVTETIVFFCYIISEYSFISLLDFIILRFPF